MRNGEEIILEFHHPYHGRTDIDKVALQKELETWDREDIIKWLCHNDPHGIYTDEDNLQEFGRIMPKEEGIEIMVRQITSER